MFWPWISDHLVASSNGITILYCIGSSSCVPTGWNAEYWIQHSRQFYRSISVFESLFKRNPTLIIRDRELQRPAATNYDRFDDRPKERPRPVVSLFICLNCSHLRFRYVLFSYDRAQYSCRVLHFCVCVSAQTCLLPYGAIFNRFCAVFMWA